MSCEYDPSYDCESGYDAVKGECCDMQSSRLRLIAIWSFVFLSVLSVAVCCVIAQRRRVQREEMEYAAYRNRKNSAENIDLPVDTEIRPPSGGYYAPVPDQQQVPS